MGRAIGRPPPSRRATRSTLCDVLDSALLRLRADEPTIPARYALRRRTHPPGGGRRAGRRRAFSRRCRGLRARRGGAAVRRQGRRGAARAGAWRRDPRRRFRRRAHHHRRRRRQGGGDRRAGRERRPRHRPEAPLDRPCRDRPGRRGRLVGGQAGLCAHRQRHRARARAALDRRRPGVRAEGRPPRHRPLQRRSRCGFRTRRARRKNWNGRARISARA